jgi:hypothetical protein
VRWFVDLRKKRELRNSGLDAAQVAAESDKSPGVLLSSGYIAGGAIAGIIIAFMAGIFDRVDTFFARWAGANNPFYAGANADALALLPFLLLTGFLLLVAREKLLAPRRSVP